MAAKKSSAATPAAQPAVMFSLVALTPLRVDGLDVAEQEVFEVEGDVADGLVVSGLAEMAPAAPGEPA